MPSTELEYLCTGLKFFLEGRNAFDRVGIPLYRAGIPMYRVEIPSRDWDAFDTVGMLSTKLEYLCTGLECFIEGWNAL
jgi:hypothetical protein